MSDPLIITAAIQGAEATRGDNPALPITAEELGEAALACRQAGAAIVHLHVRDDEGRPTQSVEHFRRAIEAIRRRTDLIIQVSTGGAVGMTVEERAQPIALRPEMATLTTGTVNFGAGVFLNPGPAIEFFARRMREHGVTPEIEVFDAGMIENALALARQGLIDLPAHFDFVVGVAGGIPARVRDLVYLVESLPPGCTWSVAGIGRHELPMAVAAIIMGGHARVGFEDNVYYGKGVLARDNAQLVERVARLAREVGRDVATPAAARRILRLTPPAAPARMTGRRRG